jgi:hypothetical protein
LISADDLLTSSPLSGTLPIHLPWLGRSLLGDRSNPQ